MSNKVSQTQRQIVHVFLHMWKLGLKYERYTASVEHLGKEASRRRKGNRIPRDESKQIT